MKSCEDKVSTTAEHLEMSIYSHKYVRSWRGNSLVIVTPGCEGSLQQEWFDLLGVLILSVPVHIWIWPIKTVEFFPSVFQHYLVVRFGRALHCQQGPVCVLLLHTTDEGICA